jgi:hypothetical protein
MKLNIVKHVILFSLVMIFSGILIWNVYDDRPVQEGMKKSSSRSIKFGMTSSKPKTLAMTSSKPKTLAMTLSKPKTPAMTSSKPKTPAMTSSKLTTETPKALNAKQEEIRNVCAIAYDRIQKDKERNLQQKLNSCNKKANIVSALGGLIKKKKKAKKKVAQGAQKDIDDMAENVDTATDYF